MKNVDKLAERKLIRQMNNKGQAINIVTGTVVAVILLILIVFALLFGVSSLNPGSFFTASSAEQNATNQLLQNTTVGIAQFSNQIPAAMKLLGVVLIFGALAIVIAFVLRFRQQAGGGGGAL